METAEFEALHFIWKRLPLHPPPEPFESMTSYLIRLAEANGLRSMGEFVGLLEISYGRLTWICTFADYPTPFAYGSLAQISRCPEERLPQTTFLPLIQRFGRSTSLQALQQFLADSLAPGLRYCPCCLAEHSLLWRFLALPGCIEHGIQLLDQCSHCQSPLPLLSFPPKLGRCPTCQGDLKKGPARRLSSEAERLAQRRTKDLQMLLSPLPEPPKQDQAKVIGKQYMVKRLKLNLLISEAAELSGVAQSVTRDIEQISELRSATASLKDYVRYADTLSCSLQEICGTEQNLVPLDQVFNLVEAAIQQLEKQGQPLTRRNIRNLVGMEATKLWDYPQMLSKLSKHPRKHEHQSQSAKIVHEEEIIKRVEQAIEQIKVKGVRVTQQSIADLVGMTRFALMAYPRVKARLERLSENLSPLDLQRIVLEDVERALEIGASLAYWNIGERIGMPKETLRRHAQVRAIVERAQNEAKQLYVNALVNRVEQAAEELLSQGKKVTIYRVSQITGLDHKTLERYPQIKERFPVLR